MWVLDHLDDLDADFRVFYRIDGVGDERFPAWLTAPRFFALAYRSPAYDGVMAARMADERHDEDGPPGGAQGAQQVSADRASLANDPVFGDLIEI